MDLDLIIIRNSIDAKDSCEWKVKEESVDS